MCGLRCSEGEKIHSGQHCFVLAAKVVTKNQDPDCQDCVSLHVRSTSPLLELDSQDQLAKSSNITPRTRLRLFDLYTTCNCHRPLTCSKSEELLL